MKKILLSAITFIACFSSLFAQDKSSKGEEFLKFFQGTFASTPENAMWIKVTLKGRSVTIWTSNPWEGNWGTPETCTLKEYQTCLVCTDRNNDGSKYYKIRTDGCDNSERYTKDIRINYCPSCSYGKYTFQMGYGGAILSKVSSNYFPWD